MTRTDTEHPDSTWSCARSSRGDLPRELLAPRFLHGVRCTAERRKLRWSGTQVEWMKRDSEAISLEFGGEPILGKHSLYCFFSRMVSRQNSRQNGTNTGHSDLCSLGVGYRRPLLDSMV